MEVYHIYYFMLYWKCSTINKQSADDCEQLQYPTIYNYSLEIYASPSEALVQSQGKACTTENVIISGNLSENTAYLFRLLVSNTIGVSASNKIHFCKLMIMT